MFIEKALSEVLILVMMFFISTAADSLASLKFYHLLFIFVRFSP